MSEPIIVHGSGPILRIQLNRPDDLNRIDSATMLAMNTTLDQADQDENVRVIVIAGDAKSFCAGGRIDGHPGGRIDQQLAFGQAFCDLQRRMGQTRAPIIACVEGPCVAGGMSILAACDLAIASEHAEFAFPEANYGLFPILAMAVEHNVLPQKVAFDLFYSGRRISAQEARQYHLVNDVVPTTQLEAAIERRVEQLIAKGPVGLALGRKGYYAMAPMTPGARLDYAQTLLVSLLNSPASGLVPDGHG